MAPTTTPTVMLMAAQMKAREMEICAPVQMASKVDCPAPPVPRIQWMFRPNISTASMGDLCLALGLRTWPKRSYSVTMG